MTQTKGRDETAGADSLVTTFHQVRSLIPADQELSTIGPDMRVADALKLMKKNHYSQLPVIVGKAVLGVFSYRSFSEKALARQKSLGKDERLGELPVEDFLEDYEFVHGAQDWNRVQRYLNQDDAFFVGHNNALDGLVTTMDVLNYFREIANPFITLAEIEQSLRKSIQTCIPDEVLQPALDRSLTSAYPQQGEDDEDGHVPQGLEELTFDNYAQVISNNDNWPYFVAMFGGEARARKQTDNKLRQLRKWRNDVFHFRRRLEPWEVEKLSDYREWLQRRVRVYEAQLETVKPPEKDKPTGVFSRQRLATESSSVAAEFYAWMLREAEARTQYYAVGWHKSSVSIRRRTSKRPAGFAYGVPPKTFEIYFDNLKLFPTELTGLRQAILAFGIFDEVSEHTLRAIATDDNTKRLKEVFLLLLDKLAQFDF